MQRRARIVVVGAGPAGSVAAERLARTGHEVHLLDRADFPRDKVCGGGLGPSALRLLKRLGWRQQVMGRSYPIRGVALHTPSRRAAALVGQVSAAVLPRRELDSFLLEQALGAGVRFHPEWHVTKLLRHDQQVVGVAGTGGSLEADLVLLATGGTTSLAPKTKKNLQCVWIHLQGVSPKPGMVELSLRRGLLPGYAWLFPEGAGQANAGICVPAGRLGPERLWEELQDILHREFAETAGQAERSEPKYKGIRVRVVPMPPTEPGLWILGEAGGLVNAATGEGIGPAMWSGLTAAEAAARLGDLGEPGARRLYLGRLWARLGPMLASALPLWGLVSSPIVDVAARASQGPLAAWGARIATRLVG